MVDFADDFRAEVTGKDGGEIDLRFETSGPALFEALHRHGRMPLPPYIRRPGGPEPRDAEDYQTVFAASEGAVAAPTAGLHFTHRSAERRVGEEGYSTCRYRW